MLIKSRMGTSGHVDGTLTFAATQVKYKTIDYLGLLGQTKTQSSTVKSESNRQPGHVYQKIKRQRKRSLRTPTSFLFISAHP